MIRIVLLACLAAALPALAMEEPPRPAVAAMSIEELADVEVTSVSKKAESRLDAAAAITVITQEDIRRSGVTTIVEALRLAPGVSVSRIHANQWAVGIRGFQSRFSRSVLVLIDGRSVYTPLFAGVYWEAQDTLLQDIERIEVIRGPGGALWGANAVNGVINIITKKADATRGTLLTASVGTEDRAILGARYGGTLGAGTAFRVYGKYTDRDAAFHATGADFDAWNLLQGGFRTDTALGSSGSLTFQGDAYSSRNGERSSVSSYTLPYLVSVEDEAKLSGWNVLGRYGLTRADGTSTSLQAYFDHTHRSETQFRESRSTFDLELQDRRRLFQAHDVTWGLQFRWGVSDTASVPTLIFQPARRTDQLYGGFVQDEITLVPNRLRLTLGAKLEHNVYTGLEIQPTARAVFHPAEGHTLWAAVSRAVRTPSRVEFDVSKSNSLGPTTAAYFRLTGDGGFVSEKVVAYELGYRTRVGPRVTLDLAGFYNDLSDLTSGESTGPLFVEGSGPTARVVLPFAFRNLLEGRVRGGEVAVDVVPFTGLSLRATYAYLAMDLKQSPGSGDRTSGPSIEGSSPRHNVSLTAHVDLPSRFEADGTVRYVDRLPAQLAEGYYDLVLRLGWRPTPFLNLSLVGQGLASPHRFEFGGAEAGNSEIQRSIYGRATFRF